MLIQHVLFLCIDIFSIIYRLQNEIAQSKSGEGFLSGVDTAGHITGFAVGVCSYLALRIFRKYIKEKKKRY